VIVIGKQGSAPPEAVEAVRRSARELNPRAAVVNADLAITAEDPAAIAGKRVLVVEDGPTLTHGDMRYGAGTIAARQYGAAEIVDPRDRAVGEIAETFRRYPNVGALLPAMGYGRRQMDDLAATIDAVDCDLVLIATPVDLRRVIAIEKPSTRVSYELAELGEPTLAQVLAQLLEARA
jgi:predicted GTPase